MIFNKLKDKFLILKNKYSQMLSEYRNENTVMAKDFNIFHILGVAHYEVSTHSSFLRELLDSNGTHGQGNLFFIEFLSMLAAKGVIPRDDIKSYSTKTFDDYVCEAERSVDTGRVDIIVEQLAGDAPFCIIIENKVWAEDQEKQIERYWQELVGKKNIPINRKKILYLSPDGHLPSEWSIDKTTRYELENKGILHCISYKKDIRQWLENVLPKVESDKVKHSLIQYIDALLKLTGGFMPDIEKNIYDFLAHPDNWQFANEISEKVNSAREQLISEFLSEIKSIIENKMNNSDLMIEIEGWNISISHQAWNELFIKLENLSNKPYIGVWYNAEALKLPDALCAEITSRLKAADQKMASELGWLGWYYTGEEYTSIYDKILPSTRKDLIDKYSSMLIDFTNKAKPIIENAVSKV